MPPVTRNGVGILFFLLVSCILFLCKCTCSLQVYQFSASVIFFSARISVLCRRERETGYKYFREISSSDKFYAGVTMTGGWFLRMGTPPPWRQPICFFSPAIRGPVSFRQSPVSACGPWWGDSPAAPAGISARSFWISSATGARMPGL